MRISWIETARNFSFILVSLTFLFNIGCSGRDAVFSEIDNFFEEFGGVSGDGNTDLQLKEKAFSVEETNAKADILFVIDNSLSMSYELRNMSDRFRDMIDQIGAVDWQIAITNTDSSGFFANDGRLLQFENGERILTSTMDPRDAERYFSEAIEVGGFAENTEQGLTSLVESINRIGNTPANTEFFREDSHLAVVVVSDEDESFAILEGITTPSQVLDKVEEQWNGNKSFMFHSIITKPFDNDCLNQNGAKYGFIYAELSEMTGGVIGSVCEEDYTKQLVDIGRRVKVNSLPSIDLDCEPQDVDGDGRPDFLLNGEPLDPETMVYDGTSISFIEALELGDYTLEYVCAATGETEPANTAKESN